MPARYRPGRAAGDIVEIGGIVIAAYRARKDLDAVFVNEVKPLPALTWLTIGDKSRPLRSSGAGAADCIPAPITVGVVNGETRAGIGVEGHVGRTALSAGLHRILPSGLCFILAVTAAAAAPTRFAAVGINAAGAGHDMVSVVPPTPSTLGETAGQMVIPPVSPEDATNVTPG